MHEQAQGGDASPSPDIALHAGELSEAANERSGGEVVSSGRGGRATWIGGLIPVALTALITWQVSNFLDRGQLRVEILSIGIPRGDIAQFTRLYLIPLQEYLVGSDRMADLEDLLKAGVMLQQAGVDINDVDPSDVANADAIKLYGMLDATKMMTRKVDVSIEAVEAAIPKAMIDIGLMDRAAGKLSSFLEDNPKPVEAAASVYRTFYDHMAKDPGLATVPTPDLPFDATAADCHARIQEAHLLLEMATYNLRTATTELQEEVREAKQAGAKRRQMKLRVLVANDGNQPIGVLDLALLRFGDAGDSLPLRSESSAEDLVVDPHRHRIVTLDLDEQGDLNEQTWEHAMALYRGELSDCELRLCSTAGSIIESQRSPFYSQDTFRQKTMQRLSR